MSAIFFVYICRSNEVRRIIKLKILYESYQGGTSHNTAELIGFLILYYGRNLE